MNQNLRLSFRRGDLFAILMVAIIALLTIAFFIPRGVAGENAMVQLYQNGSLVRELPLDVDTSLRLGGDYENAIVIASGSVRIAESTCPGNDCVHSGAIAEPGRSIVCLPNRVEIRITGAGDVDFVVR